jgi:PEP-CTERM motif
MRKTLLATALALPMLASAATNLVTNGSFEDGLDGLSGWAIGGVAGQGYTPAAIFYGAAQAYPNGAFGEAVPANNAPTNSPDAVGNRAAYFVDDLATDQTLSQTVFLNPGLYQIGFSAYAPANGYTNLFDATFAGVVAGVSLASYDVSSGPSTTWQTFAGAANIVAAGNYLIEFTFNTNGFPAKDLVIDQVYVIAGNPPPPIPEPSTYALMFAGLAAVGYVARRRRRV